MDPHSELLEAQSVQVLLCVADHAEFFLRDRFSVDKARRQARKRRLAPGRQAELFGQRADLRLCEAGIPERAADAEFPDRDQSRPVVAEVIHVGALRDEGAAFLLCGLDELREKRFLANITAVRPVRGEALRLQFSHLRDKLADPLLLAELVRFALLSRREGQRFCAHCDHIFAERFLRRKKKQRRIHTSRKGDRDAAHAAQIFN